MIIHARNVSEFTSPFTISIFLPFTIKAISPSLTPRSRNNLFEDFLVLKAASKRCWPVSSKAIPPKIEDFHLKCNENMSYDGRAYQYPH